MHPLGRLQPGSLFAGQFRVLSLLKQGGMGAIYAVEQEGTGYQRALKVMLPELIDDPRGRELFAQEAQIGGRIESEHVVQVVGAGIDDATQVPWLAMELLRGDDLAAVVAQRGALPPHEVLEVFRQLCHALHAAHRIGVVHRDLKPENIFMGASRRSDAAFTIKVLDFGVAKWIQENRTSATATAIAGSPIWMSPEQFDQHGTIRPATDVWPLGLIAFYLLAARPYWHAAQKLPASLPALIGEILNAPIEPASQRAAALGRAGAVPPGFDAWFLRCVARDPHARFRDAGEAMAALPQALGAGASPFGVTTTPPPFAASQSGHTMAMTGNPFGALSATAPQPPAGAGGAGFPSAPPTPPPMGAAPWSAAGGSASGGFAPGGFASGPFPSGNFGAAASTPRTPPRRGRGALIGVGVLVALLGVGGAAALALGSHESSPECGEGLYASSGHCCRLGEQWDANQSACVCLVPGGCGAGSGAVAANAMQTANAAGPGVVAQAQQQPQPQAQAQQQPVLAQAPPQQPQPLPPIAQAPQPPVVQNPQPQPPRPQPRPQPQPSDEHACIGTWGGYIQQSDGADGSATLIVTGTSGRCGRLIERMTHGSVCNYALVDCVAIGPRIRAIGRTSSACNDYVSVTATCSGGRASIREGTSSIYIAGSLSRR